MRGLGLNLGIKRRSSGVALPTGAVSVPSGRYFNVAPGSTLAPSDSLSNFFIMYWGRCDSKAAQYKTGLVTNVGDYLWLGSDFLASSSSRNLAYFGPNGGHALGAYGATGIWRHECWSINGNTVRGWFDGVPCDWDSGASPNYDADIGRSAWSGVTNLRLLNELAGDDYVGGIRALVIGRKNAGHLVTADVTAAMARSAPFVTGGAAESGYSLLGCWLLTTSADLTNSVTGGPALTLGGGSLGADTAGPSGITLP